MDNFYISIFLLASIVVAVVILFLLKVFDKSRMVSADMRQIDKMSGLTFEKYLRYLYEKMGYRVTPTADNGDYGADLIIEKDGIKTVIQAKRYYKHPVGLEAVQQVVAAKQHYHCQRAQVVTNSVFSQAAWNLAKSNHVWLVDRKRLEQMIFEMKKSQQ